MVIYGVDVTGSLFVSGSSKFDGNMVITGSQNISGSLNVLGSILLNNEPTIGVQGSQGNQGPTGLQGFNGSNGAQGNQGPTGLQGDTGLQGFNGSNGAQGNQGPTGLQGDTGLQGFNGSNGAQGNQGPTGLQGDTGLQGFNGSNGAQGNQGPTGTQGFQGNQGPTGAQGFQGNQGPTGAQGFQGNQGPQGRQGPQGNQGPTGLQGTTGSNAGITSYTNPVDNRVLTSVSATAINAETNLTFDGTTLYVNGALGVGTTTPTTLGLIRATNDIVAFFSSDERLKSNKYKINDALLKLNKINGYEFDWIPIKGIHENEGHDIGVIAQEIEQVLPEIVITRDNGYKAVKYEKIIPLLIESIKELSEILKKQEVEIKLLKNK